MQNESQKTELQIFDRSNLKVNEPTQTAIISAYNNTIGSGINPEAVPDLLRYCKANLEDLEADRLDDPDTLECMRENLESVIKLASKAFTAILFLCFFSISIQAQTVVKMDAKGNYTAVAKSAKEGQSKAKDTGKTYTDSKGKIYPVYESAKGKLFIIRTSAKTQKSYNVYISLTPKN